MKSIVDDKSFFPPTNVNLSPTKTSKTLIDQNWINKTLSAIRIQKCFRNWKVRLAYISSKYSVPFKSKQQQSCGQGLKLSDCFQNTISNTATLEEKMLVWRSIIELRRSHKANSTDTIIKGIIEAEGDLQRSAVLLGTKEFYQKQKSDLPNKLRKLFLPLYLSPKISDDLLQNGWMDYSYSINERSNENPTTSNSRISLIRSLREKQKLLKKKKLFDSLNTALNTSYFSKNHFGSKIQKKNKPT